MPRAIQDLFTGLRGDAGLGAGREFLVRVSYVELYNEDIRDLLAPPHAPVAAERLSVGDHPDMGACRGGWPARGAGITGLQQQ
jgi:hypothetical protein